MDNKIKKLKCNEAFYRKTGRKCDFAPEEPGDKNLNISSYPVNNY